MRFFCLLPRQTQVLPLRLAVSFFVMKTMNLMSFISWASRISRSEMPSLRSHRGPLPAEGGRADSQGLDFVTQRWNCNAEPLGGHRLVTAAAV